MYGLDRNSHDIPAHAFGSAECAHTPRVLTVATAHQLMQQHKDCFGSACRPRRAALDLLVATGRYVLDTKRRHVGIHFWSSGMLLDFQCDVTTAEEFAHSMRTHPDATVTIDRDLHADMPPLPCTRLWSTSGLVIPAARP